MSGSSKPSSAEEREAARRRQERLSETLVGRIYKPGKREADSRDLPPPQSTDRE